jgi:hypothetical protein
MWHVESDASGDSARETTTLVANSRQMMKSESTHAAEMPIIGAMSTRDRVLAVDALYYRPYADQSRHDQCLARKV